ncbi:MAG: ABC transporter substrate-binding protein, partial [Lachnospiraceae bacterium]
PEYKGLISMPNPKSSGTGYMFLKALVNAMGEQEAFQYFDKLSENILAFTSSGSGPVNTLKTKEAAIGLGMTAQTVTAINEGANLEIIFFEEGSPFSLYGQAIIKGKESRQCVKEVFDFLVNTYTEETNKKFFPEQIFKDKVFEVENYPSNIKYADMSNDTMEEKTRLLDQWNH